MSDFKPHLSVSQLNMLSRCPMQWFFRYGEGIRIPPGTAALRGSGTHTSIEHNLQHKINTQALLPLDQVQDIARDSVCERWEEDGAYLTPEEREEGELAVKGKTVDTAVALAGCHHEELAPFIPAARVEREWDLVIPGYAYDLTGVIDIETEDGGIIDTKTRAKTPPETDAHSSVQLTAYSMALAYLQDFMQPVPPRRLELHTVVATKKPKTVKYRTTRDHNDWSGFLRRVEAAGRVIDSGAFFPCDETAWCCSERWCGYYRDTCPYGRRGRSRRVPAPGDT